MCYLTQKPELVSNIPWMTAGQSKWATRGTRYHAPIAESPQPNHRISLKNQDHAENIPLQSGPQTPPNITGDKTSPWPGYKTHSFIARGSIIRDRGDNLSKFIDQWSNHGASHRGTWTRCTNQLTFWINFIKVQLGFRQGSVQNTAFYWLVEIRKKIIESKGVFVVFLADLFETIEGA